MRQLAFYLFLSFVVLLFSLRGLASLSPLLTALPHDPLITTVQQEQQGNSISSIGQQSSLLNSRNGHFSACLLYKDDNKIFPEWLAYHATVLPLKRLIVAVDPFSLTSPQKILDEYSTIINSTIWTDEDYMFLPSLRFISRPVYTMDMDGQPLTASRRYNGVIWRQIAFYRKCLATLHNESQGWTAFIDTDEYLTYHYYGHDEAQTYCAKNKHLKNAYNGSMDVCLERFHLRVQQEEPRRFNFPPDMTNQTIAQYLQESNSENKVCFIMPILPIGPEEQRQSLTPPPGFNHSSFYTYRFLNHAAKYNRMPGKGMVHVGQTTYDDYQAARPHQILRNSSICGNGNSMNRRAPLFRLNHYSGPLEDFLSRPGDTHRTEAEFKRRTDQRTSWYVNASMDWLPAFCKMVGSVERAKYLTQGLQRYGMDHDNYDSGNMPFFPSDEYVKAYNENECVRIRRESLKRNRSAGLCEINGEAR